MRFVGWMYDIAREQAPSEELLTRLLQRSKAAGYDAMGLYLEHRFAYPSAPWAAAPDAIRPETIKRLNQTAKQEGVRLIPFLNTLGHMEGFIRSEGGQWLAENMERRYSLQVCPSRKACVDFVRKLVADALDVFADEWVHLGGDEAWQLGECADCRARLERIDLAQLFAEHYVPLCDMVIKRGKRPCLWGDMLLQLPAALDALPRQTVIFDWQYDQRPRETTAFFRKRGFDVVCCPAVRTRHAGWALLDRTFANVDEHRADAEATDALGVCLTSWSATGFLQYASLWPVIMAAGRRLKEGAEWEAALIVEGGESYAHAAHLLGQAAPAVFEPLGDNSAAPLRELFVFEQDPFALWRAWRGHVNSPGAEEVLAHCDAASKQLSTLDPMRFAADVLRTGIQWVRVVELAYSEYVGRNLTGALGYLRQANNWLEALRPGLMQVLLEGGSSADLARLEKLERRVDQVIARVEALSRDGQHLPAFETLVHPGYVAGEQGAWFTAASRPSNQSPT